MGLQWAVRRLLVESGSDARASAAEAVSKAAYALAASAVEEEARPDGREMLRRHPRAVSTSSRLAAMSDAELQDFNLLLPWAAMTMDPGGRLVGSAWSAAKRAVPHALTDARIEQWNTEYPLAGKHVLEVGCFEGIHTLGLLGLGARVTAVDGRMENILKTLSRLWLYEQTADLRLWNLEREPPADFPERWDALNHIGVLYHLSDPVGHLDVVLQRTGESMLLDTHVARPEQINDGYTVGGREWRYFRYREKNIDVSPFAGMLDHAKWLGEDDLVDLIRSRGFGRVAVVERRDERNGLRLAIRAYRS